MKKYPKMKDSGVKWVNNIPEKWDVKKLKFTTKFDLSTVDRHEYDNEIRVSICHYPQVYKNEKITLETKLSKGTCSEKELEKFRLKKNDVLITKDSETPDDIGVPVYIQDEFENTVCGYHVAHLTTNKNKILGIFLFRFLQSNIANAYFETEANGVTRYGLGKDSINNLRVLIPPILEQKSISEFIENGVSIINEQILKNQKLIESLKNKKQVIIDQAVTKGLDPTVTMKDSRIEWIKQIPLEWNITRFGYFVISTQLGTSVVADSDSQNGIFLLKMGNMLFGSFNLQKSEYVNSNKVENYEKFILKKGDFLFNTRNSTDLVGKCAIWGKDNLSGIFNNNILRVYFDKRIEPHFISYFLNSSIGFALLRQKINQTTGVAAIYYKDLSNTKIILPPIEEQKQISIYLDFKTKYIDSLISKIENKLRKLQEFRQSLISSTVTGKIDVREAIA